MRFKRSVTLVLAVLAMSLSSIGITRAEGSAMAASSQKKIIIDTDIGSDIDDAFAVALALQSPELHIVGFTTVSGDTTARARILDRMLGATDHSDVPVAVGNATPMLSFPAGASPLWIGRQSRFGESGPFGRATHEAAVTFILDQIHRFPGEITLVTIGPLTNVGALIDKSPEAFRQLKRVVMMAGAIASVERGTYGTPSYGTTNGMTPEYNILADIPAAQKVFRSGVPIYLMPLDSTAQLRLDEVKRDLIFSKGTPLTDSLALLYLMWGNTTPVLFDAMPVAFVIDPRLCPVEPMHIVVDDKGFTRSEAGYPNAKVCLHSDPDAFFRFYMGRLE